MARHFRADGNGFIRRAPFETRALRAPQGDAPGGWMARFLRPFDKLIAQDRAMTSGGELRDPSPVAPVPRFARGAPTLGPRQLRCRKVALDPQGER